jgi:hypothetical protein
VQSPASSQLTLANPWLPLGPWLLVVVVVVVAAGEPTGSAIDG